MSEHPLDRLARRLAPRVVTPADVHPSLSAHGPPEPPPPPNQSRWRNGLSRRSLLRTAAFSAGAASIPWRFSAPPSSLAATTTSCNCRDYASQQWLNCQNDYLGNAPVDADSILGGIQYGIANAGAQHYCAGKDTTAAAQCQEVPCQQGYTCHWLGLENPECRPDCPPGSGQTKCGDQCVNLQTDNNNCGSCGHVCVGSSSCINGHCGCNTCGDSGNNPFSQICGGQCTDTSSDPYNCGSCGNVCPDSVNGFRGICNCGQCDGCAGGLHSIFCCQTGTCAHACPGPGETCP